MPIPLILGAISAIGSAIYLYLDWQTSESIEGSVSQMEYLMSLLDGQLTITEFLSEGWPFLLAVGLILIGGYVVATPRKRRVYVGRSRS